jgi:hypothetical protein
VAEIPAIKALKGPEKKKVGKVGWKNLWLKIS